MPCDAQTREAQVIAFWTCSVSCDLWLFSFLVRIFSQKHHQIKPSPFCRSDILQGKW
ncbi:hypothetical protein BDZ45DRAFT_675655 [Acephala macrosclerotiorum]|nr:hypothetical protein BDZ45DRAFT_675655 [Acephala macrosclerotiorum]